MLHCHGERFIVKVQRPLASNVDDPDALVYDREQSFLAFVPMNEAVRELLGDELKVYAWARIDGSTLRIGGRAPRQRW